jgi:hypothetical protein
LVTFDIPYSADNILPIVDSSIKIIGNSNSLYNGIKQVTGVVSKTAITVSSTADLVIGMIATTSVSGIKEYTIQSIDSTTQFTLSPACTLTNGATVSSKLPSILAGVSPSIGVGSGYTLNDPPTVIVSVALPATNPVRIAQVSAKVNTDGSLNLSIIDPGYGYGSTIPTITITGGTGTCPTITAVLSTSPTISTAVTNGVNTVTMTILYPTDPGVSGTITSMNTLDNAITLSAGTRLADSEPIVFTFDGALGNLVSGTTYYILSVTSSDITISATLGGTVFNPGNATGGTAYEFHAPLYGTGTTSGSSILTGISKPFSVTNSYTLSAGYAAAVPAQITVRISTCRATGHDFCDIGTGSYGTTNIPLTIYGEPSKSRQPSHEILEEGVGRCFYVSTNQDGIFRVGRFFSVDQGTGTVTFSASIALSNLDGLGFKRGVVISEFSSDSTMANNASDTVPVQSAVRGYIDKRLGLDHGGSPMVSSELIGPGFLARNGVLAMSGNLNMASLYRINNLLSPIDNSDAVNKLYLDNQIFKVDSLFKLNDVTNFGGSGNVIVDGGSITSTNLIIEQFAGTIAANYKISGNGFTTQTVVSSTYDAVTGKTTVVLSAFPISTPSGIVKFTSPNLSNGSLLTYDTTSAKWKNVVSPTGDVNLTYDSTTGVFTTAIQAGKITNTMVSSTAAIVQSKLSMTAASTRADATSITQTELGLVSFDSAFFTATNGWITITNSSITKAKMANIGANSLLGNIGTIPATPIEVSTGEVVTNGDGIKHADILTTAVTGVVTRTGTKTYDVISISTTGGNSSLIKSDATGAIDVTSLKISGNTAISVSTLLSKISYFTPGGFEHITASGTSGSNATTSIGGTLSATGTLVATTITSASGSATTAGTISGNWKLTADSTLDLNSDSATLKVKNITTDGTDTGAGTIQGYWTLTGSSRLQATYADLAEYYEGDFDYEPGTVLIFGGEYEVTTSSISNDTRMAGVVTTNPAYTMNVDQQGLRVCIALVGRTPCKVIGKIKKGDLLTTSNTPGYAIKALDPKLGSIIGKALENKDTGEAGVIEIAVGRA